MGNETGRIRSDCLREQWYKEECVKVPDIKMREWSETNDVEQEKCVAV